MDWHLNGIEYKIIQDEGPHANASQFFIVVVSVPFHKTMHGACMFCQTHVDNLVNSCAACYSLSFLGA
uniref:Uncharacterized protein n=1 Tax=Oryza brachyantha TaxID=4533 RepID=J3N657_ORYBR